MRTLFRVLNMYRLRSVYYMHVNKTTVRWSDIRYFCNQPTWEKVPVSIQDRNQVCDLVILIINNSFTSSNNHHDTEVQIIMTSISDLC